MRMVKRFLIITNQPPTSFIFVTITPRIKYHAKKPKLKSPRWITGVSGENAVQKMWQHGLKGRNIYKTYHDRSAWSSKPKCIEMNWIESRDGPADIHGHHRIAVCVCTVWTRLYVQPRREETNTWHEDRTRERERKGWRWNEMGGKLPAYSSSAPPIRHPRLPWPPSHWERAEGLRVCGMDAHQGVEVAFLCT